jgi:hypothetical protein
MHTLLSFMAKRLGPVFAAGWIAAGLPGAVVAGPVPACGTDTLSSYIGSSSLPGAGCAVQGLVFSGFTYHPVSNAPLASGIRISPALSGAGLSVTRADGSAFSAAAGQSISFEIDFSVLVDAATPIYGAGLAMPGFAGNASATEYLCDGQAYLYTGGCAGSVAKSLAVGSAGIGNPTTAALQFPGPATGTESIGLLVTVGAAGDAGSIAVLTTDFAQVAAIPEPASWASMLVGLLGAGACSKRFARRRVSSAAR